MSVATSIPSFKLIRSESRTIRPFRGIDGYLSKTEISLSGEGEFTNSPTVSLEGIEADRINPVLRLPDLADARIPDGVDLGSLDLVLTLEDRRQRKNFRLKSWPLLQAPVGDLPLQTFTRPPVEVSWAGEFVVAVSVVLRFDHLDASPGNPRLAGSWLDRKEFSLRLPRPFTVLPPVRATADDWAKWGLPLSTAFFVHVQDDLARMPESGLQPFEVYIDESIYDEIARNEQTAPGKALTKLVYSGIVVGIIEQGFSRMGAEGIEEKSVLAKMVAKVARDAGVEPATIEHLAREGEWARLQAIVQSHTELQSSLSALLGKTK